MRQRLSIWWERESCHMCAFHSHQFFTMQILLKIIIGKVFAVLDQEAALTTDVFGLLYLRRDGNTKNSYCVWGIEFNIGVRMKRPGLHFCFSLSILCQAANHSFVSVSSTLWTFGSVNGILYHFISLTQHKSHI